MQGFILNVNKARDEDVVVSILSRENLETYYRFYGSRHSSINLGFKIDFETEHSLKSTIARVKDVVHLGYPWLKNRRLLALWHQFILLFYPHLKDSHNTGSFYFDLLENASKLWGTQNPKRIAVESYVLLLEHEGRLHREFECFLCQESILKDVSLIRAFLPTHPNCSHTLSIKQEGLKELFENKSTLFLSDKEVDRLYMVLLEGL